MAESKIKDIYTNYFQKSKTFLIPLIIPKKSQLIRPEGTYMAWEGFYKYEDCMLVLTYELKDTPEFQSFEKKKLLENELFHDYKELPKNHAAYIFNLSRHHEDFTAVLKGVYSELSHETKLIIKDHYGGATSNYALIDSYLYPEKHYELYAEFLCPDRADRLNMQKLLREVGQLCDKPDLEKETLKSKVKNLKLE